MAPRPSFGDKVNGIVDFIEDPCGAPWLVYIELAKEPLRKALLTWITFGLTDVMRGYFRPRSARGRRHGRPRGKGSTKLGPLRLAAASIPGLGDDLGNFVGKIIPGADDLNQRHVSQGVKNLWIIDGVIQRGLWWWLVIGVTTDFLYEWTSLIQASVFCQRTFHGSCYASGTGGAVAAIQGWQATAIEDNVRNFGACSWNLASGSVGPGHWNITYGVNLRNIGTGDQNQETRIITLGANPRVLDQSAAIKSAGGASTQSVSHAKGLGPFSFTIEQRVDNGFAVGEGAHVWISGGGPP